MTERADAIDPGLAERLRAQIAQGTLPRDIGAARLDPALSAQIRTAGFHVPTDLAQLTGPDAGTVQVPEHLAEYPGESADLDDFFQRSHLYRRLINLAGPEEQCALLSPRLLRLTWTADLADPVVLRVWAARFPQLATSG